MTLEQRIEALEKAVANMNTQQEAQQNTSKLMQKVALETIKGQKRPGGSLPK